MFLDVSMLLSCMYFTQGLVVGAARSICRDHVEMFNMFVWIFS